MKKYISINLMLIILLSLFVLSSCESNIDKFVGTYTLFIYEEYDVHTYLGKDTEQNYQSKSFDGTIEVTIDKKGIYHYSNGETKVVSLVVRKDYIKFKDGIISSDIKLYYYETIHLGGDDYMDMLYYSKEKRVSGLVLDYVVHHTRCALKRIENNIN